MNAFELRNLQGLHVIRESGGPALAVLMSYQTYMEMQDATQPARGGSEGEG